eukprot:GHVU01070852.1.p1 GENE.GHVU01070852.1~~GHVU01070852.1.p1  ORF type:complete len:153 (+),score=19.78 GHVU01070852.1:175-633(+)
MYICAYPFPFRLRPQKSMTPAKRPRSYSGIGGGTGKDGPVSHGLDYEEPASRRPRLGGAGSAGSGDGGRGWNEVGPVGGGGDEEAGPGSYFRGATPAVGSSAAAAAVGGGGGGGGGSAPGAPAVRVRRVRVRLVFASVKKGASSRERVLGSE